MGENSFSLEFACGNAAFADGPRDECAHILRSIADKLDAGQTSGPVRDANGNAIGAWRLNNAAGGGEQW